MIYKRLNENSNIALDMGLADYGYGPNLDQGLWAKNGFYIFKGLYEKEEGGEDVTKILCGPQSLKHLGSSQENFFTGKVYRHP